MRLRLGLVGLSHDWNRRHLPALRTLQERFEVCGVYAAVASLSDSAAREFGAQRFDSYREMLRSEGIDAMLMLESDWYGTAPIYAACELGRAIYCGSEINFAPEQAAKLKDRVDESGIAFMAEFPRRYAAASLRLKELIATRLGKPEILFCHHRLASDDSTAYRNGPTPQMRTDRELVELIDWCSFIVGKPVSTIHGVGHHPGQNADPDYVALSLEFGQGEQKASAMAQISCGAYIPTAWKEAISFRPAAQMQVRCEKGLAFLDLPNTLIWFDDAGRHQESLETEMAVGQQLLTQFHRAVTSLVRKMGDLEDLYRGLVALQTARESIEQGCSLPIKPMR